MTSRAHLALSLAALLALSATACAGGGSQRYVNPNADVSTMRAVAVLPMQNLTANPLAAERVQRIFVTELVALGAFDVIEPGQVLRTIRKENVDLNALTVDDLKRLAKALNADGLFLGAVLEFEVARAGAPAANVTLQMRLVEGASATTLWSSSRTSTGATWTARLFGVGGQTSAAVAELLIHDELQVFGR